MRAGFSVPVIAPDGSAPSLPASRASPIRRREVQFDLGILLFVVLETHGLLASPSRSGLRPSFPAWPIHCSAFRHSECLTSLADVTTYYALLQGGVLVVCRYAGVAVFHAAHFDPEI